MARSGAVPSGCRPAESVLEGLTVFTDSAMPENSRRISHQRVRDLLSREGRNGEAAANGVPVTERGEETDWEAVELLLGQHGIAPYLYSRLSREERLQALPARFRESLREAHRSSSLEHFALLAEYRLLAGAFEGRRIGAIPIKGIALFNTLYDEPGLRPMQDMDWLIRAGDLRLAEEVLSDLGYVIPGALRTEAVRRTHFHLPFVSGNSHFRVELHWSLADTALFPPERIEEIWERARVEPGREMPLLDGTSQFVYLSLHAFKHGFLNSSLVHRQEWLPLVFDPLSGNRLVWLLDLWKLMRSPGGPEPEAVLALAAEWDMTEALRSSVILAQYVFGKVRGWDLPGDDEAFSGRGIKGFVHDRMAAGLLRESPFFTSMAERLQRLDHARDVRLVRGLDLLDLLTPSSGEKRRWREKGGTFALPLLHLYRLVAGSCTALFRGLRFLAGR
jgi:hypothetical protein